LAWDGSPVFSPDGGKLAYRATKRPGFEADRFAIMERDLATGATREVAPHWDRSAEKIAYAADGRTIYATAEDNGHDSLFAVDVASGAAKQLTLTGHVSDFDTARGTTVFAQDSLAAPDDLYALTQGTPQRLTDVNAAKLNNVQFGAYEPFTFPGWNNETVHGYVVKPAGFEAGKRYPVAFIIHGGPQGSYADGWSYRWNPQIYAGAGYAAVFIDFHGSTGYGQGFTDAISSHWGDRPLEDLQKGWAAALAKYPFLDGNRACALGASYGGFMIYWIAGVWNQPWKCLVDHDGVFDNRMMGYATEELWFSEWENGHGMPWEKPADYERFNPINHVADWRVPMLVIHGGHDYRIPLEQGLAAFTALQSKGIASEFLTFPDENHWVLKPQNSVEWHEAVLDWLGKYTK
jgi:acylaminoacyl-peptidase